MALIFTHKDIIFVEMNKTITHLELTKIYSKHSRLDIETIRNNYKLVSIAVTIYKENFVNLQIKHFYVLCPAHMFFNSYVVYKSCMKGLENLLHMFVYKHFYPVLNIRTELNVLNAQYFNYENTASDKQHFQETYNNIFFKHYEYKKDINNF